MRRLTDEESRWVAAHMKKVVGYVIHHKMNVPPTSPLVDDLFQYGVLGMMKAAQSEFVRNQPDPVSAAFSVVLWEILNGVRLMSAVGRTGIKHGRSVEPLPRDLPARQKEVERIDTQDELDFCFRPLRLDGQREVLALRAQGYKPREIVAKLGISQYRHDHLVLWGMRAMKEHVKGAA